MKTTYLVYKETNSGKKELAIATREEWDSVLATNRTLPREQRRFFIESRIREGNTWDCMFIETSREEYNKWHSQEAMRSRNLRAAKDYQVISLDHGCSFDDDVELAETIADSTNFEEEVSSDMLWQIYGLLCRHGEIGQMNCLITTLQGSGWSPPVY